MAPLGILADSGLVHFRAPGQRPSRNVKKLLIPVCRPDEGVHGIGTDALVTCQRCLKVRWGGDKLAVQRRHRVSQRDLRARKLGRLKEAMAPEFSGLIAALKKRLIFGHLFNDVIGTSLDVRVPTTRNYGVKVWHPISGRQGWRVQMGNIKDGPVSEKSYGPDEDLVVLVGAIEAFIDSFKQ